MGTSCTIAGAALLTLSAVVLGACGDRQAKVETPTAAAVVSTSLPKAAVSDQKLKDTALSAAVEASTPSPNAVAPREEGNLVEVKP